MSDGHVVTLRGIGKHHGKGAARVIALDHVDLTIEPSRITVLVGPSGSGKSTLLNLIGLIDRPDAGRIDLFGEPAPPGQKDRETLRRTHLGFVFQSFNLIATLSATENVELALLMTEASVGTRRARADAALSSVGLDGMGHRFPHQLSGGQQQRVAIARAIVHRPLLILADEPTANLDATSALGILDLFRTLRAEMAATIVVASHDPAVSAIADHVVTLKAGRLAATIGDRRMEAAA